MAGPGLRQEGWSALWPGGVACGGAWGLVLPLLRRSCGPPLRESWCVSRVRPAGKVPELVGKMGGVSPQGPCALASWTLCVSWMGRGLGHTPASWWPPGGLVSELEGAVSLQGAAAIQQPAVGEAPAGHQGLPELRHTGAVLGGGTCRVTGGPGCLHRSSPSSYPGPR